MAVPHCFQKPNIGILVVLAMTLLALGAYGMTFGAISKKDFASLFNHAIPLNAGSTKTTYIMLVEREPSDAMGKRLRELASAHQINIGSHTFIRSHTNRSENPSRRFVEKGNPEVRLFVTTVEDGQTVISLHQPRRYEQWLSYFDKTR